VKIFYVSVLCLMGSLSVGRVMAQSTNAAITGRVTDPTKAVIGGAQVAAVNTGTNVRYEGATNGTGSYVIPDLPPGPYRLEVEKPGFKTIIETGVVLHVQDTVELNFELAVGAVAESVTVSADQNNMNTTDATVSTVIDRNFVENLPLNGRSFNTLLQLTPGVVIASTGNSPESPGQFSIGGQRTDANNFTVDGVSANFGVGSETDPGASGTGSAQAFSALGGTSSLVSVDALQEFRIETSSFAPEFGRSPGGQVILTTRSGTNDFHGGVFDYFRNTVMDANDWFAKSLGVPRAPEHHNDFGGFLGGPIWKDKTFFFLSYEGARLDLPATSDVQVPYIPSSVPACSAPAAIAPFLEAYPKPNGPVSVATCTGQFIGSYSNRGTLDAGSVRIDHTFNDRFALFGRYNEAPSEFAQRIQGNNPSDLTSGVVNTRTVTLGFNASFDSQKANTFRANYSTQQSILSDTLDSFGGAIPPPIDLLLGILPSQNNYAAFFIGDIFYQTGPTDRNTTRQINFVDDFSLSVGTHQMKYGVDYRRIDLDILPPHNSVFYFAFSGVPEFLSSGGQVFLEAASEIPASLRSQSLSLYAQDTWKVSSRFTITYGIRWELAPAPTALGTTTLASWTNVNNPSEIALAPSGTQVWHTTYGNFAPRAGMAYALTDKRDFILRAGGGIFYDLGVGSVAALGVTFPHSAIAEFPSVQIPIADLTPFLGVISTSPPYGAVQAFAPSLKLPRSYQWNVALEKSFGGKEVISATYVGQAGRDLLRQEALYQPNSNFDSTFQVTQNDARSNYNALQLQFRRPLSARLQALLSYTWSHSLDNASNDVVAGYSDTVISAASDYTSSNFDVRHSFSGALVYDMPAAAKSGPLGLLTRNWSIDSVIVARSGFPFNAQLENASPGLAGIVSTRPDVVPGQPFWVSAPSAPGGKMLNINAFSIPSTVRQGTEGRNDIPGFGLTQIDLSVARKFPLSDRFSLQFRADAFNVLNHPNFLNPSGFITFGISGLQSTEMLNQGLGGLNPLFQEGGPRSIQLSLRLAF
jgi:hypothetical protein